MTTKKQSLTELELEEVGVRELRQSASKYLARVKKGESFVITEWGHPIAILQPPKPASWQELVDAGFVTAAVDPNIKFDKPLIRLKDGVNATDLLIKARASERS